MDKIETIIWHTKSVFRICVTEEWMVNDKVNNLLKDNSVKLVKYIMYFQKLKLVFKVQFSL